jgi:hypothetical protein
MCVITFTMYSKSYSLPQDYNSAVETVEETKSLLMKYDNLSGEIGNIGNGLESIELKQALKSAIENKNNLKAEINSILNNPLSNFKGNIRIGLKYPI